MCKRLLKDVSLVDGVTVQCGATAALAAFFPLTAFNQWKC